ncbi:hypothetical protein VTO42DRAFT_3089 [Malbranchea cinnamomea]
MPVRTRHSHSGTAAAVEPKEEQQGGLRRLKFNKTLSWRAGKPIPVADLLQRLKSLASELREFDQDDTDRDSLTKISHELAGGHLLGHRDKGVRAWTTCCVVDILRLCAPDAPFTANQLKDIFTTIVTSIIPALADPSNAYNDQHVYILSSLAEVKSIILITDLDAPDSLILSLFSSCFDIVSGSSKASTGEALAKNVEYDMIRLLVPVIDEAPTLAPEVVDVIVAQFLRVDPRIAEHTASSSKGKKNGASVVDEKQGTLLLKEYPPAYNMAKAICNACPDKMTSYISQYFNNVIIDASGPGGLNGAAKNHRRNDLDESEDEEENVKELSKAHRLIRELWRACPDVLQNVIPQIEAELSADSVSLRLLATQTIGDLVAGIGVAGPPPPARMDPAAYPPLSWTDDSETAPPSSNALLTPRAPKPFSQVHSAAYESFLTRRQDKSASVRAAWATAIGRILLTSAGGAGLSESEERDLLNGLARMLGDADEKVRTAAVKVIGTFGFPDAIKRLGGGGGLSDPSSVFGVLAERVKDRKHSVRVEAMTILARLWGVSAGEIEANNDMVVSVLKDAPSKILDAFYTNNLEIQVLLDHVIFEQLLPLNYPPIKTKGSKNVASSQTRKLKGIGDSEGEGEVDSDTIRVRRILTLVRGLDDRAKKVFFALQARQLKMVTFMNFYLAACEEYNGGVMDENEDAIKAKLTKVVDTLSKMLPESHRVSADLWKFAKMHDRRSYQLIRFAMAAASDYQTVTKAIKELAKRIQSNNAAPTTMLTSLLPLIYRSSSLIFNRSHVPAIMKLSRTDEHGLGNAAHEMLRETSSQNPEVLEAHVQDMCKDLETQAPTATQPDDPAVEEILKACAGFAKKLPSKLPTSRNFYVALTNYALYSSSPRAAKHAISILMAATDKKQMYARELIRKSVQNCTFGSEHFLTKLATISQLNLLAPREADEEGEAIISIATQDILLNNRSPQPDSGYAWSHEDDEETMAKEWALKILVNRVRARDPVEDAQDFNEHAEPVYDILNTLISQYGELSQKNDTPATQKSRLRLLAAKSILKLCAARVQCDQMFKQCHFNAVALLAQDPLLEVRSQFIGQLKKKLVQPPRLPPRWYTIAFLLAFEPNTNLYDSTLTWLRSRAAFFTRQTQTSSSTRGPDHQQQPAMESLFSRLLSLLAHHPDYPPESSDEESKADDLLDFTRYILFYLTAIANENNISLIFHIAQRVKQTRDAIIGTDEISTRLHTLSDLSQAVIRRFAELYSQQHKIGGSGGSGAATILQTYPGKMRLPSALFANLSGPEEVQEVVGKNFLPEAVDDRLDKVVRVFMKPKSQTAAGKKRKVEGDKTDNVSGAAGGAALKKIKKEKKERSESGEGKKRAKRVSSATAAKLPRRTKKKGDEDDWEASDRETHDIDTSTTARRRSERRASGKAEISYVENDSEEDDLEMEEWDREDEEQAEESGEDHAEESPDEDGNADAVMSDGPGPADDGDGDAHKSSELSSPPSSPPAKSKKKKQFSSPVVVIGRKAQIQTQAKDDDEQATATRITRGSRKSTRRNR